MSSRSQASEIFLSYNVLLFIYCKQFFNFIVLRSISSEMKECGILLLLILIKFDLMQNNEMQFQQQMYNYVNLTSAE